MENKLNQCPCCKATKCEMSEPCLGCETYGEWLELRANELLEPKSEGLDKLQEKYKEIIERTAEPLDGLQLIYMEESQVISIVEEAIDESYTLSTSKQELVEEWIHEDELTVPDMYDILYPYSKVIDRVRMFPKKIGTNELLRLNEDKVEDWLIDNLSNHCTSCSDRSVYADYYTIAKLLCSTFGTKPTKVTREAIEEIIDREICLDDVILESDKIRAVDAILNLINGEVESNDRK